MRLSWLRPSIQPVTEELAESLRLPEDARGGPLVADVKQGGPAAQAGLQRGDLIRSFDGAATRSWRDLSNLLASSPIGKEVEVRVIRDGEERTLMVKIAEAPEETPEAQENGGPRQHSENRLGLLAKALTPEDARELGIQRGPGVLVVGVQPGGLAEAAGLRPGDVIQEVNREPIKNLEELKRAWIHAEAGKSLLFLVRRGDSTMFLATRKG